MALLIGCFVSCDKDTGRLKDIDAIMETEPEKAMKALEKVRPRKLSSDNYAYYALLYTQAQIKCGVAVASDSLIRVAYDVYGRESSGDLKKRACFYNAQVSYNKDDLKTAMRDALTAYEMAKDEESPYWVAKSAELMGDIFYDAYNYIQAEVYTAEAVKNYKEADKTANHRYALCDLASTYLNEGKNEEAMLLLDSLVYVVKTEAPVDSALMEYIRIARQAALLETDRFENLNQEKPIAVGTENSVGQNIGILITNSYMLDKNADVDSAMQLLFKAYELSEDEKQRIIIQYAAYRQHINNHDYRPAAEMADSLLYMQSKIVDELLKESVTGVQRDFYSTRAKYQERKSKLILYTLVVFVIVAIIITVLLIWVYKLRIRAKKAELEANLSALMQTKEQLKRIGSENERLSAELFEQSTVLENLQKNLADRLQTEGQNSVVIEHLFREKWSTLNMLCTEYFDMGDSESSRHVILNNIEKELKKLRTKKSLGDIETAVNKYMSNVVSLLREECTFLKEEDIVFLTLVYAGLSVKSVCLFLDIKYKLFYLKKSRLSKRIAASDAPHKVQFLAKFK